MKKVLITGNSGYIGSHLTKLLSKNYHVYGLDENKNTVPVVEHFLEDVCNIKPINIEFDTVIHLAALVNVNESERNPIDYYHVNLNGTLKVLHHTKFKNFIFASTGAAENCHSPYGISKRAAEDCVRQFFKEIDITYTIFRFYNVIGADGFAPTNPDGLMHNLIKAKNTGKFTIFGNDYNTADGTCIRDYVHVNEVCDAIQTAINRPANNLENLGHGVGYSVQQIVDLFSSVNDVTIDVAYGDRRSGDLEKSVLDKPSTYMKNMYTIKELLKI